MNPKYALALPVVAATLVAIASPVAATPAPPAGTIHDVIGTCGPSDDLVADFVIRERSGSAGGTETLHLRLSGTVTRTGTGRAGRYAETQLDRFGADGSAAYAGVLSHFVVRGGGGYALAGRSAEDASGTVTFTPGLAPLFELDFVAALCGALA